MSEETNQEKNDNIEENNIEDTPNKKNKTKRKRKELINDDSDEEEHLKNKNSSKKNKEESKEEENTEYSNNKRQSKYTNNKFSTIDKNNIGSSPFKDNPALQEKLKKIFMNRDKLKFQYMKHDIPDNLKYHSDDSDSSDVSGLKKSKILKKNNSKNWEKNLYNISQDIYQIKEFLKSKEYTHILVKFTNKYKEIQKIENDILELKDEINFIIQEKK